MVQRENRRLVLERGGHYVWHNGKAIIEGAWIATEDRLPLMEASANGKRIPGKLRVESRWRPGPRGEVPCESGPGAVLPADFFPSCLPGGLLPAVSVVPVRRHAGAVQSRAFVDPACLLQYYSLGARFRAAQQGR